MIGTLAFLLLFSLIERPRAIPLAFEGWVAFAVSCALLLLTCFEGAILWQTEIDTGTSAAATPSAPDTAPPDHRPPRQRARSQLLRQLSLWPLHRQRLTWLPAASLMRRRLPLQPLSQPPSRAPDPLPRRSRRNATFLIPAHGVSIASG